MGSSPSSMCKPTMLNEATVGNKMVHQSVGGSIATALRDHRQSCVIPIQPNRSLPVHPAPHHTHCRNHIVKTSSCLVRTNALSSVSSPSGRTSDNEATSIAASETSSRENDESSIVGSKMKISRHKFTGDGKIDKTGNHLTKKRAEIPTRETEIIVSSWRSTMMLNRRNNEDNKDEGLIDISASPEITDDPGVEMVSDEANWRSGKQLESASSGCCLTDTDVRPKKKRRRRAKISHYGVGNETTGLTHDEAGRSRIVPPLRLKKIRNPRQLEHPIVDNRRVRPYDETNDEPQVPDSQTIIELNDVSRDIGSFGSAGKYRIVTGQTPPYDHPMDCSTLREPRIDNLDAAKLRYKKSKLIVKLGQLKSKTVELDNEMPKTIVSSPNGPHSRRELQIRQKLNRYKIQIENLEKLLTELPEVASYVDDTVAIDCDAYDSSPRQEVTNDFDIPPWNSSSRCSSPCQEPPKLSPKFPNNYESSRSPSELRNSPPILPRAYVTIADSNDDSADEKASPSRHKGRIKRKRSPEMKDTSRDTVYSTSLSATIGETMENHIGMDFELNDEKILHRPAAESTKSLQLETNHLDVSSSNSLDVVEIYTDSENTIETKGVVGTTEDLETTIKHSTSPLNVAIDKTCDENEEPARSMELRVIDEAKIDVEPASSPYDVCSDKEEEDKNKSNEEVVTLMDVSGEETTVDGIPICERFPTLANWIATLSKKQIIETSAKLPEVPAVDQPSTFQVISSEAVKTTTQQTQRKAARAPINENAASEQWRNEDWQQAQQQQRSLLQPYATTNVALSHSQQPSALGQDVCSPIAMAGFYARNYLDHYSMAYGYNPTIAAAASLWNSAAILQYPLMRPTSGLLSPQQSRISSVNHQYPGNPVTAQRAPYRAPTQRHNEARRAKHENSLNYGPREPIAEVHSVGLSNSVDRAKRACEYQHSVPSGQSRISLNSVNPQGVNYRNLLQQSSQRQNPQVQRQFGRTSYGDSRLGIPGGGWRSDHLIRPISVDYNYSGINGWSANSSSVLNSRATASTPSFVAPTKVLSMNSSSRSRIPKASVETNFRNCDTPNLGKILTNPNNPSNYECSNCGLTRPMFKCLGCEVAFYCDENCQALHWNRHVKSCPKKMPKLKKVVH